MKKGRREASTRNKQNATLNQQSRLFFPWHSKASKRPTRPWVPQDATQPGTAIGAAHSLALTSAGSTAASTSAAGADTGGERHGLGAAMAAEGGGRRRTRSVAHSGGPMELLSQGFCGRAGSGSTS